MKLYIVVFILLALAQQLTVEANSPVVGKLLKNESTGSSSILSSGKWIKVAAKNRGMLKLTYDQLKQMGISLPENIAVYTNGGYMLPKMNNNDYPTDLQQIPVIHSTDANGKNAVFFFCTGNTKWEYDSLHMRFIHEFNLYSDKTYFYLTSDLIKSAEPITKEAVENEPAKTITTYGNYSLYEEENINLARSGRTWFGDRIMQSSSKTQNFKLENPSSAQPVFVTVAAAAKAKDSTYYRVKAGGQNIGSLKFLSVNQDVSGWYTEKEFNASANQDLKLTISYDTGNTSADSYLDFIRLNYTSNLIFSDNQVMFRSSETIEQAVSEFQIQTSFASPLIMDVTNPLSMKKIQYNSTVNGISFKQKGGTLYEYIIFSPSKGIFEEPTLVGVVKNQNLHLLPPYEMIIVSHPKFISAAEKLAVFHRSNDNLKVLVITPEEIYNEFSSGLPDPAGIRNMLRYFYNKTTATDSLRYVLFMGDGSYNNRLFDGTKSNYIPTWQSIESLENEDTYQSDDFFVLFDENEGEHMGRIDAGIGRIPCSTLEEANGVVNKIIHYASPESMGNWRNVVSFIADDEDSNNYPDQSEDLINIINKYYPGFFAEKIYFDAFPQIPTSTGGTYPAATDAINRRVANGSLILNYIGHANELFIANEVVLDINNIKSWTNYNALPIFVTATCEISRFDADATTAGEHILLNPSGGGIALFTTTRVVFDQSNFTLSKNFYNNVFKQDKNGENLRLGDIMRLAKNATSNEAINMRKFTLLGDPALQLAFPQLKAYTKSINGIDATSGDITVGALGLVTVKGFMANHAEGAQANVNGKVLVTIYDKKTIVQTLNNDGIGKFEYPIQNNIIYKGTSTVKNGEFEFSFIVPKDISYNIDQGKIFYYFSNDTIDGNGAFDNFKIGGTSPNPVIDKDAPAIKMYLNSDKFKNGDKVSTNALLMVDLNDESGINTVGTGIGHDIVAVIDSNYSDQIVLNEYYASEADNFKKGKIVFPLNNLSAGWHTISIKVWDVQNNSVEKEISFFVEDGFKVLSTSNYPNPVDFYTNFVFRHNLPGSLLDAKIEVFNLNGHLVSQISETINSTTSTEAKMRWEATSLKPTNQKQMLIYRVTLKNAEGYEATGTGKFLLNSKN